MKGYSKYHVHWLYSPLYAWTKTEVSECNAMQYSHTKNILAGEMIEYLWENRWFDTSKSVKVRL